MQSQSVAVLAILFSVGFVAAQNNAICSAEGRVCSNGGVCRDPSTSTGAVLTKTGSWSTPSCACPAGFSGQFCQYKVRECSNGDWCMNGGTCVPATCKPVNSFGAGASFDCFTCTCATGYTSSLPSGAGAANAQGTGICDMALPINDCTNGVRCSNGGNCTSVNQNSNIDPLATPVSTWTCTCPIQYQSGTAQNCTQVRFNCRDTAVIDGTSYKVSCLNGGTCPNAAVANGGWDVPCQCPPGYYGNSCEMGPACSSNPCQNGATCSNTATAPYYSCNCTNAVNFEGPTCAIPTYCSTHTCQNGGTCVPGSTPGTGSCSCTPDYNGANGLLCNVTKFCSSGPSLGSPCVNNGTCNTGTQLCSCPTGYAGTYCEIVVPGCATAGGCPTATSAASAACSCIGQTSCVTTPAFESKWKTTCSCNLGFGDGRCNSTYISKCPAVTGSATGDAYDNVCQHGGSCYETSTSWGCACRTGYWGDRCQNYDNPCLNYPCQNGGACDISTSASYLGGSLASSSSANTIGIADSDRYWAYQCTCKWPYYGRNCENKFDPTVPVCTNNDCKNGGTCGVRTYTNGNFLGSPAGNTNLKTFAEPYTCTCPSGWTGLKCEVPIPGCAADGSTCVNGGTCLVSASFPFQRCACTYGFSGPTCNIQGQYEDGTSFDPFSTAAKNLQLVGRGRLNFCLGENPCQNGGSCVTDQTGQYATCLCPKGYTGQWCAYTALSSASGVAPTALMALAAAVVAVFAARQ